MYFVAGCFQGHITSVEAKAIQSHLFIPVSTDRPFLQRVMVWACFSKKGLGPLCVIEGSVNSTKYLNILQQHLIPKNQEWFPDGNGIFEQDNAPLPQVSHGHRVS